MFQNEKNSILILKMYYKKNRTFPSIFKSISDGVSSEECDKCKNRK